jgi:gliding motility-associated protein GldC
MSIQHIKTLRSYPKVAHKRYDKSMRTSEIKLSVRMNSEGIQGIEWEADEAPEPGKQQAKAMILALWDPKARNSLRIDLWTQDMSVDDMNDFFFQTLLSMADTYKNATNNKDLMAEIKMFARDFAEKAAKAKQ